MKEKTPQNIDYQIVSFLKSGLRIVGFLTLLYDVELAVQFLVVGEGFDNIRDIIKV